MERTMSAQSATSVHPHQWPRWWRIIMLLNVSVYNALGNMFVAGMTPLFDQMIQELHITPVQVSRLNSYAGLALGLSNILAVVSARCIGKRLTVIVSMTIFLACITWNVYVHTYDAMLVPRVIGGLFAGVIEALGPEFIVETFQATELASALVIYSAFLGGGSMVGPILAGLIGTGTGQWQWYFKFLAILTGANLLGCILMLPESSTDSLEASYLDQSQDTNPKSEVQIAETAESISPPTRNPDLWQIWYTRSFTLEGLALDWSFQEIKYLFVPFFTLRFPAVLVATIIFGISIGWTALISVVIANVFQAPPTLWTARAVGLLNIAPLIGLVCGMPIGGFLADMVSRRSAKKNGGVHKPESRLPVILLGGIVSPAGSLIVGLTMHHNSPWIAQAVGWGIFAFGFTAGVNVALSYAVDSYPQYAAQIGLCVNVVKNLVGFGISYEAMVWYDRDGPVSQFATMSGVLWACYLLIVPLYFFGRRIRGSSHMG